MKYITNMCIIFFVFLFSFSGIITNLDTNQKIVAITFDACETTTPSYFDDEILNYIIEKKLPTTLFLSGKFIERNREEVMRLSKLPFIEIENHSYSHKDFRKLSNEEIVKDVINNEKLICQITGKKPKFFRFPYGYYNDRSLKKIEELGYKIVHWSFESGDPDKNLSKESLILNVLNKTKEGSILIFHINGRGWKTKYALPEIVERLLKKEYKFIKLSDIVK